MRVLLLKLENRKSITNNDKGYTLLELLVVCTIIGILATMSVTLVSRARVNARETAAVVTLNSLAGAWESYWARHGTYPHWGEGMEYSDPQQLFRTLTREGYLPSAYSQVPYYEPDNQFYHITDDYALEIFPFTDGYGNRAPSNYYWLLFHPMGFQKQQGYLGIGTDPSCGKSAVRARSGDSSGDINQFTVYSLHHGNNN
jgi:prepilin-type N-terminal cleavage/methylation domain-containing protein